MPPHGLGNGTHGETGTAYSEGAAYVPMVLRSLGLWRRWSGARGRALLRADRASHGPRDGILTTSAKDGHRAGQAVICRCWRRMAARQRALPADWQTWERLRSGWIYLSGEASSAR